MSGKRLYAVCAVVVLVLSVFLNTAGGASALPAIVRESAPGVQCYFALRAALGAVLPSGFQGYRDPAVCAEVLSSNSVQAVSAPASTTRADLTRCYWRLREELGTVLPGRGSDFLSRECESGSIASTR
jgi:hypothetical protein